MTKKHDEKVAAEEHDAEIAKRKEDEKRLKKTAKKLATVSRLQVLSHALEPKK
jgi:C4-dicarboxylate-specific signal transduction histidine kinase